MARVKIVRVKGVEGPRPGVSHSTLGVRPGSTDVDGYEGGLPKGPSTPSPLQVISMGKKDGKSKTRK